MNKEDKKNTDNYKRLNNGSRLVSSGVNLKDLKKVYCIGAGGIGISAVERMLLSRGVQVSGSDRSQTIITKMLEDLGARIYYDQTGSHVTNDCDLVLYSTAIPDDNTDLVAAKKLGLPLMTYPQIIGVISQSKKTIQITGTHGKTTVSAMAATMLHGTEIDPTIIVGSLFDIDGERTNYVEGKGDYFVVESCEYKRSFRHIDPYVLLVNNLEEDHLDYYKDLNDIQSAFREVVEKVPVDGAVICNPNDQKIVPILDNVKGKIIDYTKIDVSDIDLKIPGEHNRSNARAVSAIGEFLGLSKEQIKSGLEKFKGTWRRFEYIGQLPSGAMLYDDYAHHPTAVEVTLEGFKEKFPDKRIVLAFHPHLYSRTKDFKNELIDALSKANEVVLAPIFPAREEFDPTISSEMLAEGISKKGTRVTSHLDFDSIVEHIKENTGAGDVVVTMGAGDIYKIAEQLL